METKESNKRKNNKEKDYKKKKKEKDTKNNESLIESTSNMTQIETKDIKKTKSTSFSTSASELTNSGNVNRSELNNTSPPQNTKKKEQREKNPKKRTENNIDILTPSSSLEEVQQIENSASESQSSSPNTEESSTTLSNDLNTLIIPPEILVEDKQDDESKKANKSTSAIHGIPLLQLSNINAPDPTRRKMPFLPYGNLNVPPSVTARSDNSYLTARSNGCLTTRSLSSEKTFEEDNGDAEDDSEGTAVHILTPAFSFPMGLSRKEVKQKTLETLQMQEDELSFHQIAPKTLAVSFNNSAFSLNYLEEVFRQNEVMNTTIQQFGEALVTLKQKVEQESSWREKFEKQQKRILELEERLKTFQSN